MELNNKSLPVPLLKKFVSKLRRGWWSKGGFIALPIFIFTYFLIMMYLLGPSNTKRNRRIVTKNPFLIDTPSCRIPNLLANSSEAMEYIFDLDPISCGNPPLVESNDTHLQLIHSVLPKYGVTDTRMFSCCYRHMWRHEPDIEIKPGDINASWMYDGRIYANDIRFAKECVPFSDSVEVTVEFVRIECQANGIEIYKDYHGFIPTPKPIPRQVNQTSNERRVNIVIVGMDSLSRLNMIRKMPKTYNYLTEELGALPMYGYNKVGLNTFPNVLPMLSGYSMDELRFCWPNPSAKFDLCPLIWKSMNYRGYATAFIEDTAFMGLFILLKQGFLHQPTQYDARPILYTGERDNGHNSGHSSWYCIGSRSQIQMVTEYTHKVMRRLRHFNQNHFVYSWGTSFSHDHVNVPQHADEHYYNFLKKTHNEGLLEDTFLIFMSDHGLRFGPYLNTRQGQVEGLLPALLMVAPKWFQEKYPKAMRNLEMNQKRLMTTYDIHRTFYDLIDLQSLTPEYLDTREVILREQEAKNLRGLSLFLPLPEDRDCAAAGVPIEFCACRRLDKISIELPIVSKMAFLVVGEINAELHRFPDCVPLVLKKIQSASFEKSRRPDGGTVYQVTFFTEPGDGLFLASVFHLPSEDSLKLIGDVSRLNAYGNQSYCVPDAKLRLYCFCVN